MKLHVMTGAVVFFLSPAVLAAANSAEGRKLVQAHKCETCHQDKVYGPTGTIYQRKDRKVTSWAKLRAQVAGCNSMLNIGLFPDEEEHIAAYLNETYYKFPTN
jgi:cytochrome c5